MGEDEIQFNKQLLVIYSPYIKQLVQGLDPSKVITNHAKSYFNCATIECKDPITQVDEENIVH
jgi:hypothetical protein